jgi:hypothetical protein
MAAMKAADKAPSPTRKIAVRRICSVMFCMAALPWFVPWLLGGTFLPDVGGRIFVRFNIPTLFA